MDGELKRVAITPEQLYEFVAALREEFPVIEDDFAERGPSPRAIVGFTADGDAKPWRSATAPFVVSIWRDHVELGVYYCSGEFDSEMLEKIDYQNGIAAAFARALCSMRDRAAAIGVEWRGP